MSASTLPVSLPVSSENVEARLAYELAAKLQPAAEVFKRFGYSNQQAQVLMQNPGFKQLYKEALAIWHSSDSVKARIRAKAGMLVEDSIMELFRMIHDVETAAPAKIEAFKQIVNVADLGPPRGPVSGMEAGGGFTLNISIQGREAQTIEAIPVEDADGE